MFSSGTPTAFSNPCPHVLHRSRSLHVLPGGCFFLSPVVRLLIKPQASFTMVWYCFVTQAGGPRCVDADTRLVSVMLYPARIRFSRVYNGVFGIRIFVKQSGTDTTAPMPSRTGEYHEVIHIACIINPFRMVKITFMALTGSPRQAGSDNGMFADIFRLRFLSVIADGHRHRCRIIPGSKVVCFLHIPGDFQRKVQGLFPTHLRDYFINLCG